MKRSGKEFSKRVRKEARRIWHENNPGMEDQELQVHHRLPISKFRKYRIPKRLVTSEKNAQAVTPEKHVELHETLTDADYAIIAQALLGLCDFPEFD